jgi:hypothetical protein
MIALSRRIVLAGVLACAVALPAAAADKSVELGKVFPYLDAYLKIPPAERSRFTLAYRLTQGGKPITGVKAWIVQGATRIPVTVAADGRVEHLPTLAQIQGGGKLEIDAPPQTKFGISMEIEPVMRPAAEMDASALSGALEQAATGAKKAAGVMGFAIPKMERIYFRGGAGGEVIWLDGKHSVLGTAKGMPVIDAAYLRKAKTIRFAKPPTQMFIGPAK